MNIIIHNMALISMAASYSHFPNDSGQCAEFVVIRLDMGKMGSFLWFSMCVVFPFVSPAMSMRGVKKTSAALSATPAISATKVVDGDDEEHSDAYDFDDDPDEKHDANH
ncbi:uncharacterized protein LOC111242683 [Vigna radiata var. radiata]|uniref:Uncharacterized protein LOC111242683 n=1 Tax=Vigna radiata var. radiata TaxID=3916 RepID=A0A3Q0FGT6_VIGRR|nr:uncharacterized protein LOC111242683 [Vigna radiata var. radiata]